MDYPLVMKRLEKWGATNYLEVAHRTLLSPEAAKIWVRAILGEKTIVRVKRTRSSWAYKHNGSVTLACSRDQRRVVRLSHVLHECAHHLDFAKGKLADGRHGESFTRTYLRLLRAAM